MGGERGIRRKKGNERYIHFSPGQLTVDGKRLLTADMLGDATAEKFHPCQLSFPFGPPRHTGHSVDSSPFVSVLCLLFHVLFPTFFFSSALLHPFASLTVKVKRAYIHSLEDPDK